MDTENDEKKILWDYLKSFTPKNEESTKMDFLQSIPFFAGLTTRQIKIISTYIHERDYSEDECFFEYGQPGAALFIIRSGEVSIEIPNKDNTLTQVTTLSVGTFLGELALLDQTPRTATARALVPTKAYALFREDLSQLIEMEPEIACQIYKSLSAFVGKRLIATTKLVSRLKNAEVKGS